MRSPERVAPDPVTLTGPERSAARSNPALFDLTGRVALVTGVAGGIGQAVALGLAEAGADVAVVARDVAGAEGAAEAVRAAGGRTLPLAADVARVSDIRRAIPEAARRFGGLDILVNVAGVNLRKPALEVTEEEWDRLFTVNVRATFFACQEAARVMIPRGKGRIINVTSLTAEIGLPHLAVYGASRGGGVSQLTRALAVEWAPLGINVNAIAPGRIQTRMTEDLFRDEAVSRSIMDRIPLGRAGTPRDVAGAAVFLASDASNYMVGQILYVDGGWLASGGNPAR